MSNTPIFTALRASGVTRKTMPRGCDCLVVDPLIYDKLYREIESLAADFVAHSKTRAVLLMFYGIPVHPVVTGSQIFHWGRAADLFDADGNWRNPVALDRFKQILRPTVVNN